MTSIQEIKTVHAFIDEANICRDKGKREDALILYHGILQFCQENHLSSIIPTLNMEIDRLYVLPTGDEHFYRQTRSTPGDRNSPAIDILHVINLGVQKGAISHWETISAGQEKWNLTGNHGAIDLWFDTQEAAKEEAEKLWPRCTFENADKALAFEVPSMGI